MSGFGEFELIARLRSVAGAHPRVPLGIGDDAAVIASASGERWLVAADMLLEGRHFDIGTATPRQIGRKALAVNLSDIAAMAGRPVAAFVTVAHRREYGVESAEELHAGIQQLASDFDVAVAGGDTNVWDGPVVVSVTLLGEIIGDRPVPRNGAQPGDSIFVTGRLGGSLASGRHLTFRPRVEEAAELHRRYHLNAMIDISDGLLADLTHICEESNIGATLFAESIPLNASSTLEEALTDGEDFELAFCVSEADAALLREATPPGEAPFYIGTIIEERGIEVVDGNGTRLNFESSGWVHRW